MLNRKIALTFVAGGMLGLAQAALAETPSAVLDDAASRTSMAGDMAGYQGHFFVGDGGGNKLEFGGFAQLRYNMNIRRSANTDPVLGVDAKNFTHGFQNRKIRLWTGGTVGDPNFSFKLSGDFADDPLAGSFELRDAVFMYNLGNGMTFVGGQFKGPGLREEMVGDENQLLAERSVMNSVFSQGRSQGIALVGQQDQWRYWVGTHDGLGTLNTDFDSGAEFDFAVAGRVEFLAMGKDFSRFDQFSSWGGQETAGLCGASVAWESGGSTGAGTTGRTTDADAWFVTLDSQWGGDGWNAFGSFIYRSYKASGSSALNDMGFCVQGGYFFQDNFEGFARWDAVFPDKDWGGGTDAKNFNTLALGVNYYLVKHSNASKVTAQFLYYMNNPSEAIIVSPSTNLNLLDSSKNGQFGFLVQWQGVF